MATSALQNPSVIVTIIGFGCLAVALTLAVVRSWHKPLQRAALNDALDIIQSSELDIDTALTKDEKPREGWAAYWLRLTENSGRVPLNPGGPGRFAAGLAVFGALGGVLVFPGGALGLVAAPLAALAAFRLVLKREAGKRTKVMEEQLPILIGELRANLDGGTTPVQALIAAADEMPAPLGDEMRLLKRDLSVNMDVDVALDAFADRVPSRDLKFLVASIRIVIRGGADLDPQLAVIESIVAQRTRIRGKLAGAVAQSKPTQMLAMGAVPFMLAFSMLGMGNTAFWFSGLGIVLMGVAALLYGAGFYLIKIMVKGVENS